MQKKIVKVFMIALIFMITCQHICYAYVEKPDILLSGLNILETVLFLCLLAMGLFLFVYTKISKKERAKDILTSIFHVVGLLFAINETLLSYKRNLIWDLVLYLSIFILFLVCFLLRKKKLLMCLCISIIVLAHIILIIDILIPTANNDELFPPQPVPALDFSVLERNIGG